MDAKLLIPFRWHTIERPWHHQMFLASTPEEFIRRGFAALGLNTSLTGSETIRLQHQRFLIGPRQNLLSEWRTIPIDWPNDLARLEEILPGRAEDILTSAFAHYYPTL